MTTSANKHERQGRDCGNSRNGHPASVITEAGPVEVSVPRSRKSSFEPKIVANRQLTGVDELVISLSAKGLLHGEINTHLTRVYGSRRSFPGRRTGSREGRAGLLRCLLIIPAHDVALHHPRYSVAEKDCATMGLAACPFR
jgi:hypothetical protein